MKGALKLGSVKGIGIFIHWTFILLILFIIYSDAKEGYNKTQILWSIIFVISIFFTVLLHELGHSLMALRYNIRTRDITLLPIGGLARLESIPEKPKEEFSVAIAGPLVNVGIAIITGFFISLPTQKELIAILSSGVSPDNFFVHFYLVNISLAVFNLIPAFPMDGGRIFRALLSYPLNREKATRIAVVTGQAIAILFCIIGFYISAPLIFIGIFIFLGAKAESQYTQVTNLLKGYKVKDIVMKQFETMDASETINTAVNRLLNGQSKSFIITHNNEPVGSLNRDEIIKALSGNKGEEKIGAVMNNNLLYVNANLSLEKAFEYMQKHKNNLFPVVENNKIIGAIDTENILEFMMIKEAKAS